MHVCSGFAGVVRFRDYVGVIYGLYKGVRDTSPIMKNKMEKNK